MNNYFNTAASGLAVASSHNPTVPKISVYDKVTFYAQEGCVLDKIYGASIFSEVGARCVPHLRV